MLGDASAKQRRRFHDLADRNTLDRLDCDEDAVLRQLAAIAPRLPIDILTPERR